MCARHSPGRPRGFAAALTGIVCLVIACVMPQPAQAEDDPESLIAQGVRLRRQGKDLAAQGYFRRAYEMAHTPRAAAQLGLVELAIADFWHAEVHFSEALTNPDAWVTAQKTTIESSQGKGRKHLAPLRLKGLPSSGTVEVSLPSWKAPETAKADADGVYWVPDGQLKVVASAPGFKTASTLLTTVVGTPATWSVNLEALAPHEPPKATPLVAVVPKAVPLAEPPKPKEPQPAIPAPADSSDEGRPWRYTGLALAVVGTGAVIGGFVSRSIASTKLEHINSAGAAGTAYDDGDGNWKTYDGLGIGLIVGGVATALGGGAVYFFNRAGASEGTAMNASPSSSWNFALGRGSRDAFTVQGRF